MPLAVVDMVAHHLGTSIQLAACVKKSRNSPNQRRPRAESHSPNTSIRSRHLRARPVAEIITYQLDEHAARRLPLDLDLDS